MTSKLPWAAVAIIVVAAVGAWALWGQAPAAPPSPPTPGPSTITGTLGPGTAFGAYPDDNSGIENIYIVATGQDYAEDFNDYVGLDNVLGTITASAASVDIAFDTQFAIVVAVTGHTDNMGALTAVFMTVALEAAADSADWTIPYENSDDNVNVSETIFMTADGENVRFNVVWENGGNYYTLAADDNLDITNVDLWLKGQVG